MRQMNQNTFSMQNVLNHPMDPNLCKRILDQIKSPLMQQSFVMTNDQSYTNSILNAPKRPNIPPPSKNVNEARRPAIKTKYSTYNDSFYQASSCYDSPKSQYLNKNKQQNNMFSSRMVQSRIQLESIVSPLDPTINYKQNNLQHQSNPVNTWASFLCGQLTNLVDDKKQQISYEPKSYRKSIVRRKIFQNKPILFSLVAKSKLFAEQPKQQCHIQVENNKEKINQSFLDLVQVKQKLKQNNFQFIANFVQLLVNVAQFLQKAQSQRQFLSHNIDIVYQLVDNNQEDLLAGVSTIQDNHCGKVFNRMNFKSMTDMLQKLSKLDLMKYKQYNLAQFHQLKNKTSQSIERMIENFSNVQKIIEVYTSKSNCINDLQKIHSILNEKFTTSTTKNTFDQLNSLFKDIKLKQNLIYLQYIWPEFQQQTLNQQDFINGLVRNQIVFKKTSDIKADISSSRHALQSQLSRLGFVRN